MPKKLTIPSSLSGLILFTPNKKSPSADFAGGALKDSYTELFLLAEKHGLKLYRASTEWYDADLAVFRQAWHWDGSEWALAYNVVPQVIYDKASSAGRSHLIKQQLLKTFPLINHPSFSRHAGSKLSVSQAFQKYSKPYFLTASSTELSKALRHFAQGKVVAKPDRGNSGKGISIMTKHALLKNPPRFPILLQEFVDSKTGIPGIMKGLHDLRLIFSGETLLYTYYRSPKKGSYLANVAQGGTQTMVMKEDLPHSVWTIVKAVQKYYQKYRDKIYTIDLMFDKTGRPWIVELNTMPGLYPDESERPHINKLYLAIIHSLKGAAQKKSPLKSYGKATTHHHGR